jgi:hypothetical protein
MEDGRVRRLDPNRRRRGRNWRRPRSSSATNHKT